nr:serine/threonine-protein phosphatase 7 long form homolog [Solanum lycopersicum]
MTEDQCIWEPYSDDLIESLPIWRVRAPIFCWDIVEVHLPDRVMRKFGLNQTIPTPNLFDATHFHHDRRGRPNTNWKLEHAQWLPLWNQRLQYVCDAPVNREPLRYDDPYLIWFRRITRLVIGNPTQRPQQQEGYVPIQRHMKQWCVIFIPRLIEQKPLVISHQWRIYTYFVQWSEMKEKSA